MPDQADHRAGVAVSHAAAGAGGGRVELVINAKAHPAGAHAGNRLPVGREGPVDLAKHVGIARCVVFVAAQQSVVAGQVVKALAGFTQLVGLNAQRPAYRQLIDLHGMRPAGAYAAIAAVEVDHAVGLKCQLLIDLARAAINARIERVAGRQLVRHHQTGLLLRDGLAGVEGEGAWRNLARVLLELRVRQPQRVLRQRLVKQVDDAGERGVGAWLGHHLGVELLAPGGAVVAKAVGGKARHVE